VITIVVVAVALAVVPTACIDRVDEAELQRVERWAVDVVTAVETALGPARRRREADDHELLRERIGQHADGIATALDAELPPLDDVRRWQFELVRRGQAREVDGDELAETIENVSSLARGLETRLREVAELRIDDEGRARLDALTAELPQALSDLRSILILPR
jgi:hypothetical protein